jgi:hypothetical protein
MIDSGPESAGATPPERLPWWLKAGGFAVATVVTLLVVWVASRPSAQSTDGTLVFEATFDGPLDPTLWKQGEPDQGWKAGRWTVKDGRLHAKDIHNAAIWLKTELPEKVRVEFDARAHTKTGDVKCEIFGDGRNHQSGYIVIFGGWKNSVNTIARHDEHAEERKEDNRLRVEPDVDYRWAVQRTNGTLEWYLDGKLFLTYPDDEPARGRHFAFNNWEAATSFDNLRIYDLSR